MKRVAAFAFNNASEYKIYSIAYDNVGNAESSHDSFDIKFIAVTGINENEQIPGRYYLYQNYPNPFNPSTAIRFELPKQSHVTLKIYNIIGQEMVKLIDEVMEAGREEVIWNASQF